MNEYKQFYVDMGWRLKTLRQSRMSQEALAEQLRLVYQTVQKYEDGSLRIPPNRLWQLSKIFGVPVGYFFGEEEGATTPRHSRAVLMIAGEIARLPDPQLQKDLYHLTRHINDALSDDPQEEGQAA